MKYRAALLLILLILVPLLILGWLGYRLQQNEQQLVGLQLQKLIEQQLESVDGTLQNHFQQLESLLQRQAGELYRMADPVYTADRLRGFVKSSARIEQLFVLAANDRREFPPRNQPLSIEEQQLVERLQPLWQSPGLFHPEGTDPVVTAQPPVMDELASGLPLSKSADYFVSGQLAQRAPTELAAPGNDYSAREYSAKAEGKRAAESEVLSSSSASPMAGSIAEESAADEQVESDLDQPEQTISGWIAWYVDARLMHIFWWRDPEGRTLGFVLDDARLLSDLIGRLPDAVQASEELGQARIQLLDSQSNTLYGWGDYRGEGSALRTLGLSHPLGSWRLEYHAPSLQRVASPLWLSLIAPLLLLGVGLVGLGYLLYREQRREMLLASQRVNFVNQVSHELKTPLTNVRLYAEMLQQRLEGDDDPATNRYLGVITGESQRLSRLIDNVLSFSRLQRRQLKPAPETADPDEQIQRILDTFTPLLRQRGIKPLFEPGIKHSLRYDRATLEQILNNLLSNCEKYAPDSGELRIRSWLDGEAFCVELQDRGPGIEQGERQRVFEPFYRSSSRLTDGVSGTGIGLGLARDLARDHGGDLTLEDSSSGSRFLICLKGCMDSGMESQR